MPIFQGSRYTNMTLYNQQDSSSYVGKRVTSLHASTSVGDAFITVRDPSGMFKGAKVQIIDGPNTETLTVDWVKGPHSEQMWDSTILAYTTMTHYHAYVLNGTVKFAHAQGTIVTTIKSNHRPFLIPTTGFRDTSIVPDGNDEVVLWRVNDRIDIYAKQRYGDAQLGWAILDANPQYLSELDIQVGDRVIIPNMQKVKAYLRGVT